VSSLLDDILGNGLRILLLGSYDGETKEILYQLKISLDERFERYASIALLIETVDVYISFDPGLHDYILLFEGRKNGGTVFIMKGKTKLLESIDYDNEEQFQQRIGNTIDFKKFRKLTQLEKVSMLAEWADLIYLVRHLESTRGGEFVELVYLLVRPGTSMQDRFKYEFFYKKGIEISTMMKEIVINNKIDTTSYNDDDGLKDVVFAKTAAHISRLNVMTSRFKDFE
jgi:hypothetical protein